MTDDKKFLFAMSDDVFDFIGKITETADKLGFDRNAALGEILKFLTYLLVTYTLDDCYIEELRGDKNV